MVGGWRDEGVFEGSRFEGGRVEGFKWLGEIEGFIVFEDSSGLDLFQGHG